MKTFKSIIALCIVLLCISVKPVLAFNDLEAEKIIENEAALSSSPTTTTRPKGDCATCTTNVLINPSFEDKDHFNGWTKSTGWGIDGTYAVCGDDAAVLQNKGSIYQDVQVVPNTEVTFSIWGGYHKAKSQTFKLSFLDSDKNVITSTIQSKAVDWNVDTAPSNVPILKKYSFTGTAPANAVFVRAEATSADGDWFKVDGACMTLKAPAVSCSCDGNVLKNASFEDGNTASWTTTGTWNSNTYYDICGEKAQVLTGAGSIYQDILVNPGTFVNFSMFGGYHKEKGQKFKLSFYNGNNLLTSTSVDVDWDVDIVPSGQPILKKYTLNGTAPANTTKVRVEATSGSGDYFKIDGGCVQLTVPPVACCTANMLKNGSFEDYTTVGSKKVPAGWESTNGSFTWDDAYAVCGSKNGLVSGAGSFWQDVRIAGGSSATLTIWGGYHNQNAQTFKLQFVMSDGTTIVQGDSKTLNKSVETFPKTSNAGLTQYTLTATAPAGAKYVRVFGSSNGDFLKVDAACLTISVPVCETCNDNKLLNPSFETGTGDWTKIAGSFETSEDYVVCGTKSGKLINKSTIAQEKSADPGSSVTFSIYAGVNVVNGQKLRLRFLNADRGEISIKETAVTKIYSAATVGLQKYTVAERAPQNTRYVSVELVSNGDTFIFDLGCLSMIGGTPLPVTLTEFGVKKEGNAASLVWKTTMETNSKEFEVQHSLNGKQWEILGVVAAEGESNVIKTYSYTHTNPSNGSNLYRLRMIDNDLTFAYSRIVSEDFITEESAVLYPNPSSNFMKLKSGVEKIASIQIYDVRGIKVRDFVPGSNDIDISSLDQGTYIVTFKQISGLVTKQRIQVVR